MQALTKDLVAVPEHWRLSLRLTADALDVFAHPFIGEEEPLAAVIPFEPGVARQADALQEAIYANPLLLQPFGRVDFVVASEDVLIVPNEADSQLIAGLFGLDEDCQVLESAVDNRSKAMFMLPKAVANFITRTFERTAPRHELSVLAEYFGTKGRQNNASRMFVDLGERSANILAYGPYGLIAAKHIDKATNDDVAYWTLAIFKEAGLDAETNEIMISGDSQRRHALMPQLNRFVSYVMPAIFPAAAYHGSAAAMRAPFSLSVISLCE